MKFPKTYEEFWRLRYKCFVILIIFYAIFCIFFHQKAYAHVDLIGFEALEGPMEDYKERREQEFRDMEGSWGCDGHDSPSGPTGTMDKGHD